MSVPTTRTITFNTLLSSTIDNYRPKLADNITRHNPLLAIMKARGGYRELQGGEVITHDVLYRENDTVRSFSNYESFNFAPQEATTQVRFDWKQLYGTAQLSNIEIFKNSGSARRRALLALFLKQLTISFKQKVATQLAGDGTGNGGKDLAGLQLYVEDGSPWNVVGGIDSNTTAGAFWRNKVLDFGSNFTNSFDEKDIGNDWYNGLRAMRTMYYTLCRNSDKPTIALTGQTRAEEYEAIVEDKVRLTRDLNMAKLGFSSLRYKDIEIVYTPDIADSRMYFLDLDHLHFTVGKGHNFRMSKMEQSQYQDARMGHMILYANLTIDDRARQGVIYNIN